MCLQGNWKERRTSEKGVSFLCERSDLNPATDICLISFIAQFNIIYHFVLSLCSLILDFIRQNEMHLRVDPASVEAGTVCPNPASWHRADECLKHMGMAPSKFAGQKAPEGFYALLLGLVGTEAAIALTSFVKEYEMQVSAEDIVDGKVKTEVLKGLPNSTLNGVIDKVGAHCKDNKWSEKQAKRVAGFADELGGEMLISLWNGISQSSNLPNIQKVHKIIGARVVAVVQESRNA